MFYLILNNFLKYHNIHEIREKYFSHFNDEL